MEYKIEPFAKLRNTDLRYANLSGANLSGADLSGATLRDATLYGANLRGANLRDATLSGADLRDATLHGANLRDADLSCAALRYADLSCAALCYANLSGADLRDANLFGADLPAFQIVPETGSFEAYKNVQKHILRLLIPHDAKRTSSLVGRKCRAEFADVLEVCSAPCSLKAPRVISFWGLTYEVGQRIHADKFDDDIRVECTHGIHFFMTRQEAEDYV